MNSKKIKWLFISSAAILLLLTMMFGYLLNISSLKRNLSDSLKSTYTLTGKEAVRIIEYSVKYGKPLDGFFGMNAILEDVLQKEEAITAVRVFDSHGKSLYKVEKADAVKEMLTDENRIALFSGEEQSSTLSIEKESTYFILIPIRGSDGVQQGGLELTLANKSLKEKISQFVEGNLNAVGIIIVCAVVLMLWLIPKALPAQKEEAVDRKRLLKYMIIIVMVTQGAYSGYTLLKLKTIYTEMALRNGGVVAGIVSENVSRLLDQGLTLQDLKGIEKWLDSITNTLPDIENIVISSPDDQTVYYKGSGVDAVEGDNITTPVKEEDAVLAQIKATVSNDNIQRKLWNVLLDSLSVLIASILVYIEVSRVMVYFLGKHYNGAERAVYQEDATLIRALAFLFIFATDLSLSFIPILSRSSFASSHIQLSENIAIALPIQAEMLTTSIFALATGMLVDRKGWRPPFLYGIVVLMLGSVLCAWSPSFWIFVGARGLVGAGYGLSWTSFSGYVGNFEDENNRRRGFADLVAGIYAGSNCGVVTGAMLAERLSYRPVFIVAAMFALIAGTLGYLLVHNTKSMEKTTETVYPVKQFLKEFSILRFFIMLVLPGMSVLMFLNYYIPLYSENIGLSPSNLGRLFLIYGLAMIYLGPYLTEKLGQWLSSKQMMLSAAAVVALSLMVFSINGSVVMLIVTLCLISVADSYGLTANTSYYTELEAAQKVGRGKAIGILSTVRKFGMMLGPYVFGLAFIYPRHMVMLGVGVIYLLLIIGYGLTQIKQTA